jgi:hypothetical protein
MQYNNDGKRVLNSGAQEVQAPVEGSGGLAVSGMQFAGEYGKSMVLESVGMPQSFTLDQLLTASASVSAFTEMRDIAAGMRNDLHTFVSLISSMITERITAPTVAEPQATSMRLTTDEAAAYLRKSISWLLRQKDIPYKYGKPNTYLRRDLDHWFEKNKHTPKGC